MSRKILTLPGSNSMVNDFKVRVIVIDDYSMICNLLTDALARQPGLSAVGTGMSDPEGIEKAFSVSCDIVLMDIDMPSFDVIEAIQTISSLQPSPRIIVLTSHIDLPSISRIFESGAVGFVNKIADLNEVLAAIRTVMKEKPYFSPIIRQQFIQYATVPPLDKPLDILSRRQREILTLIAKGKPAKEIAFVLNLSVSTVNLHRRKLTVKLGIDHEEDLNNYAVRKGLISTVGRFDTPFVDEDINRPDKP